MTQTALKVPCFVVPVAGPDALLGAIGVLVKDDTPGPLPLRVEFYSLLNGEGDSRRSTVALNYAEHELIVVDPDQEVEREADDHPG
jgi:hypothetical protein